MPRRRFVLRPSWVRYCVADLIDQHVESWADYCLDADRLAEGPTGDSPSEMHRQNRARPRMETRAALLDIALKQTGPVRREGRLFASAESTSAPEQSADDSFPDAATLFVEIISPIDGRGRLVG